MPDADSSPPVATIRAGDVSASTRKPDARPELRVQGTALDATAVASDPDGGVARVRVSINQTTTCPGRPPKRSVRYLPPPAIERIKITPGTLVPTERRRSARIEPGPPSCEVSGEVWAEAVNAHGLESVSPPVRFTLPGA